MGIKHRIGKWLIPRLPFSRFAFDILRNEFNASVSRLKGRVLPHLILRRRRLQQLRGIYLNVGSAGFLLPGFVHLDLYGGAREVIQWDCSGRLPFGTESAKRIRIEHFLEHVEPREHLPKLLADCYRILQRSGILRVVVPDAERFLFAYCAGLRQPSPKSAFRSRSRLIFRPAWTW